MNQHLIQEEKEKLFDMFPVLKSVLEQTEYVSTLKGSVTLMSMFEHSYESSLKRVYTSAKQEVIEEVLKMKQEAYNEQEAITFDMLNDIVYMGAVPPDAPRKVRNLQFVKVYDIVKYAVKNGISLKEKSELSAKSEEK